MKTGCCQRSFATNTISKIIGTTALIAVGGFAGQGTLQAEEAALHVTLKPIINAGAYRRSSTVAARPHARQQTGSQLLPHPEWPMQADHHGGRCPQR